MSSLGVLSAESDGKALHVKGWTGDPADGVVVARYDPVAGFLPVAVVMLKASESGRLEWYAEIPKPDAGTPFVVMTVSPADPQWRRVGEFRAP